MPQLQSLLQLRERCRERADMPDPDQFVLDTELNRYIQKSYERLYNVLVGKYEDYFIKIATEADLHSYPGGVAGLVSGVKDYSLPADYFKLRRIAVGDPGVSRVSTPNPRVTPLIPCTWAEELALNPQQYSRKPSHFILHGRKDYSQTYTGAGFRLVCIPDQAYAMDIVYVPVPDEIPEETGGVDFVAGWDEWLVLDVVMKMSGKEERDLKVLISERDEWMQQMDSVLSPRDGGHPGHINGTAVGLMGSGGDYDDEMFD